MNPEFQKPPLAGPRGNAFTAEAAATESESLRKEVAEQKDLNLRLAANFENFKRRSRQEGEARAARAKGIVHP